MGSKIDPSAPAGQTLNSLSSNKPQIIFASLSGSEPRYIQEGPERGFGWAEFETYEIRRGVEHAGFSLPLEWMTPARIEHEFQVKNPICTWPVEIRDPVKLFSKKPDRIYSIPLALAGAEIHQILVRKEVADKLTPYLDAKGDLKMDEALLKSGLKTLLIRDKDYGDINALVLERSASGEQEIKPQYKKVVELKVIRESRQLVEMVNAGFLDFVFADSIDQGDFAKAGLNVDRFKSFNYQTHRINDLRDPKLRLLTIACSIHPTTLKAMPYFNEWIRRMRRGAWSAQKSEYRKLLEGSDSTQYQGFGSLASLTGGVEGRGFQFGGGDYWYVKQIEYFPELKLSLGAQVAEQYQHLTPPRVGFNPGWHLAALGGARALFPHSFHAEGGRERSTVREKLQGIPDDFLMESIGNHWKAVMSRELRKPPLPLDKLPLQQLKSSREITLFARTLSVSEAEKLEFGNYLGGSVSIVSAGAAVTRALVQKLPKNLVHLSFLDSSVGLSDFHNQVNFQSLMALDLSSSQVTPDQLRHVAVGLSQHLEKLGLGFLRGAFPKEVIVSFSERNFPKLQELDLQNNLLTEEELSQLLRGVGTSLRVLKLSNNIFSPSFVWEVCKRFPMLQRLEVASNSSFLSRPDPSVKLRLPNSISHVDFHLSGLSPDSFQQLIWPLQQISYLDLSQNSIKRANLKNAFQSLATEVAYLSLSRTGLTGEHLKDLITSGVRRFEILDLSYNSLNDDDMVILASAPFEIKRLLIGANRVRNRGVEILAKKFGPGLVEIDLSQNFISHEGINNLLSRLGSGFERMNLSRLLEIDVQSLSIKLPKQLVSLNLSFNSLYDEDLQVLGPSLPRTLESLSLQGLSTTIRGVDALIQSIPDSIKWLSIRVEGINFSPLISRLPRNLDGLLIEEGQVDLSALSDLPTQLRQMSLSNVVLRQSRPVSVSSLIPTIELPKFLRALTINHGQENSKLDSLAALIWPSDLRRLDLESFTQSTSGTGSVFKRLPRSLEAFELGSVAMSNQEFNQMKSRDFPSLFFVRFDDTPISSASLNHFFDGDRILPALGLHGSKVINDDLFENLNSQQMSFLRGVQIINTPMTSKGLSRFIKKLNRDFYALDISSSRISFQTVPQIVSALPDRLRLLGLVGLEIGQQGRALFNRHAEDQRNRFGVDLSIFE